jgi:hypothetical protein
MTPLNYDLYLYQFVWLDDSFKLLLTADLISEANQQTGTRELTDLSSEANQWTGTKELTDLSSEANQQTGTRELPLCQSVG